MLAVSQRQMHLEEVLVTAETEPPPRRESPERPLFLRPTGSVTWGVFGHLEPPINQGPQDGHWEFAPKATLERRPARKGSPGPQRRRARQ